MSDEIPLALNNKETDIENDKEGLIRPNNLKDFLGQTDLKDNLNVFITAAKNRGEALDHLFISGPPGLGKTTIASIIATEMQSELVLTSAPALDKPKDLVGLLTTLNEKSIFFIDEIHRLKPTIEEMLYIAMEDYEIDFIIGAGSSARSVRVPIPPFTLVGATTKPGKVSSPLHSRFGINLKIDYYETDELSAIIKRTSKVLNTQITDDASLVLASCARGTPRIANRLLKRVRDFAEIDNKTIIDKQVVTLALKQLNIDNEGLENQDRAILKALIEKYDGGPVGLDTLALAVGENGDSLEDFYEPYLIQKGFIKRTPRGRMALPKAYTHLNIEKPTESSLFS